MSSERETQPTPDNPCEHDWQATGWNPVTGATTVETCARCGTDRGEPIRAIIDVHKTYMLDEWELDLNLDTSPKIILETVLDCVARDIMEATPMVSVDEVGRVAIWFDAGAFEISIPLDALSSLFSTDDENKVRGAISSLAKRLNPTTD